MKTKGSRISAWLLLLLVPVAALSQAPQFVPALPGYRYEFPRDYFNHEQYQTEWWYYTGNLQSADGHHFGFELTFFRQGLQRNPARNHPWDTADLYLAHLALSDLDGGHFYHEQRLNRAGPGIAGASEPESRIWNGNWEVRFTGDTQTLRATNREFALEFHLQTKMQPMVHGENGVSQKAEGVGRASHYFSLTRLATTGTLTLAGKSFAVSGTSWMDHEFFTHQLSADQAGWDWLSLQLSDNTELMLFHLRKRDGTIDSFSAGTFVDAQGTTISLHNSDFVLIPLSENWTSPATHATYPLRWKIAIPKLGIQFETATQLKSQEITGNTMIAPSYWEGAISLHGQKNGVPLTGVGYLEMTGYDRPLETAP